METLSRVRYFQRFPIVLVCSFHLVGARPGLDCPTSAGRLENVLPSCGLNDNQEGLLVAAEKLPSGREPSLCWVLGCQFPSGMPAQESQHGFGSCQVTLVLPGAPSAGAGRCGRRRRGSSVVCPGAQLPGGAGHVTEASPLTDRDGQGDGWSGLRWELQG